MRTTQLRIAGVHAEALRWHLFPGDGKEAVAFALCGRHRGTAHDVLVVNDIMPIAYADCQGPTGPCSDPDGTAVFASKGSAAGPGAPSIFTDTSGTLWMAYNAWTAGNVGYPTIEVHISNPARRGAASDVATSCLGTVTGFGVAGYALALRGLKDRAKAQA